MRVHEVRRSDPLQTLPNSVQVQFEEALHQGNLATAESLLSQGAKVDPAGYPLSLHIASLQLAPAKKIDALRFLFDHGLDINSFDDSGRSVLYHVASRGDSETFKWLLTCNPDLTQKTQWGYTALHEIVDSLHFTAEAIDAWVAAGGSLDDVTNHNETALTLSCKKGKVEKAKALVGHNADLTIVDDAGKTAVYYAIRSSIQDEDQLLPAHFDLQRFKEWNDLALEMIQKMPDPNACIDSFLNQTPLLALARYKRINDRLRLINNDSHLDLLLQRGAKLTLTDQYGNTVYHIAAKRGDREFIRHLFAVSPYAPFETILWDCKNRAGFTAAQIAAENGYPDIERLFNDMSK